MRCFRLCFHYLRAVYPSLALSLGSVRRFSELFEIIEVSISCQPLFYLFSSDLFKEKKDKSLIGPLRNYQNTVRRKFRREAWASFQPAVTWVWIRLALGSNRDQTLGLRFVISLTTFRCQGRSLSLFHYDNPLSSILQAANHHCDLLRVSTMTGLCNSWAC